MLEFSMFDRLPLRSQTDTLNKDGIILGQRIYNGWTVTLYSLHNVFVERWTGQHAEVISTFKTDANKVAILEPYLSYIQVEELLDQLK
ncbi:hypothetical protein [Pontibacter sp. H249]|uniref:hypothetical protein n=1 Tax=Pontibacter sp. H249 TaxID=3133420 RepID=UPI0030C4B26D